MKILYGVLLVCLLFVVSAREGIENEGQSINQQQNDYQIFIYNDGQQVKIFMKCKIKFSCALRITELSSNFSYFQIDMIENQPKFNLIEFPNHFNCMTDYSLKSDKEYNYVIFSPSSLLNLEILPQFFDVDISLIEILENNNFEYRHHFSNIYQSQRVFILTNSSQIEDYKDFQDSKVFIPRTNTENQNPSYIQRFLATDQTDLLTLVKRAHSLVLLVIWGFLVDISIICVRYFKAQKKYLRFHASTFAVGNISSLIVIFCQIGQRTSYINNISQQPQDEVAHFAMGVCMTVLITFQHLIGLICKFNFENEDGSQNIHYLKLLHKITGYLIYLLGKVNVMVGVNMFEKRYFVQSDSTNYWMAKVLGGIYAIQFILLASIEFTYRQEPEILIRQKKNTNKYADINKQKQHADIIELLNNHTPVNIINKQYPNILYVVHENSVYDITEIQHPGGQFILKHIKGKEISRYFNGGYAYEGTTMSPYRHTLYAQNFLKEFYIGDIKNDYYNIFIQNEQNQKGQAFLPKNVFKLSEVREIITSYKVFLFQHDQYQFRTHLPGVRWFGRSVVVSPLLDAVSIYPRNYSVVLAYMEENYKYRLEIIRYFQYRMRDEVIGINNSYVAPNPKHIKVSNQLPLLIKKEDRKTSNGLSKFMHLNVHKLYYISEPVGHGLEIDENSDGEHIIFAAGTGILPFLDLFDYLLRKLLYTILLERFGFKEAQILNPYNENYEKTFRSQFKIRLFGAFRSKAECYGYQIISDLHTFCQQFEKDWFQAVVRFANSESDEFLPMSKLYYDNLYINDALSKSLSISKFLICGPPEFNKNIYNILTTVRHIDPDRVQIV
ncbi:cytochrome b5-like heme/steroid-binding domain protein (macronuclear) [Tetrahymena thermophila SB210]|uniref:Cytochrome b5-like heme/steroid-binding domain protein n=1 Tax=Tetrahymena thermophila (strain SB210) TaxID=312017 RepID=Q23DI5_TETTS|nr:cytochrome b5-like heme/steroid-binding domain protein [Tetrahymena thermophila SB210]EAR94463.2 cytochrome b5-like heme/steroid-binding domain protein [Tetrahymena thermophila SB210]|eukprot:XP_001014701.2 cytochrome b5-like heme/steroid-binding domain protein [Tetrahymena thermophila SB210]